MEKSLYCYDLYRGYDIFVECYVNEDDDSSSSGGTDVQYCGSIYKDNVELDLGNSFASLNGEVCLGKCIDWIDCELTTGEVL